MKKIILITLLLAITCIAQAQTDPIKSISGKWTGELNVNESVLPLVFHLKPDGTGSMDSPAQGAMGIPVGSFSIDGDSVVIDVSSIGGRYTGTLDADGSTIDGVWAQGGGQLPLIIRKAAADTNLGATNMLPRAVEPAPELPYRRQYVEFASLNNPQVVLAGTLTLPKTSEQPLPAIVLISGSGGQDRDSTLFGHRPFKRLADELTLRGFAVLRFDDRGVGESSGDFALATTFDFADDALGGVHFLRSQDEIDVERIVLLGHSEGGLVAQLGAERDKAVAGVVQIASPVLPYSEFVIDQVRDLSVAANEAPQTTTQKVQAQKEIIAAALAAGDDPAAIRDAVLNALIALGVPQYTAEQQAAVFGSPWLTTFLNLDPRPVLEKSAAPVLMIWGETDLQINAERNAAALDDLNLKVDVQVAILEGHNHLMQEPSTGLVTEYASAGTPMSDELIDVLTDWLGTVTGSEPLAQSTNFSAQQK